MPCLTLALALASAAEVNEWPASFALPVPDYSRFEGVADPPSDMPVSSVLRAALELIGEDLDLQWGGPFQRGPRPDLTQAFLMGMTGEAFAFLWLPKDPGRPPLDPTLYWPDPAAPYERSLAAAGFACEVLVRPRPDQPLDGQMLKDRVRGCLADRHLPVIVAGVPDPWCFLLVTGYEEDGEVLNGWQASGGGAASRDPADMTQVTGWTGEAQLVVLITGRQERPDERRVMREALGRAVGLMRMTEAGPYHSGPATYEAWAEAFRSDDPPDLSMSPNPAPTTKAGRYRWLICPGAWDLMERATYADKFIGRAAALFPDAAEELERAAKCMRDIGSLMVDAEKAMGGSRGPNPEEGYPKADDPEVRCQVADMVLQCRDKQLEAAGYLEKALEATH